jgi:hypothetical protein
MKNEGKLSLRAEADSPITIVREFAVFRVLRPESHARRAKSSGTGTMDANHGYMV